MMLATKGRDISKFTSSDFLWSGGGNWRTADSVRGNKDQHDISTTTFVKAVHYAS